MIKLQVGVHELIFDDDVDLVDYMTGYKITIFRSPGAKTFYAKRRRTCIHREMMGLQVGDPREVDHENGNGLDFRRVNLRICTGSQNCAARPANNNKSCQYRGVVKVARGVTKPWRAQIGIGKFLKSLGQYANPEQAALAYNKAAFDRWGNFARLNEVPLTGTVSVI